MPTETPTTARPVVLTAEGHEWIEARLQRCNDRLQQVEDELARERTEDLIREREQLQQQSTDLTRLLRHAVSPGDVADNPEIVEIGDEVEVEFPDGSRESFLIVHPAEAGMDEHRTSAEAPLATAVLGSRLGDRVTVTSPAGVYSCTVTNRTRIG
jgi:transcription elongation factor GreA